MTISATPPGGPAPAANSLPLNADGHFIQLEGRVGRLETDVGEIKTGINQLLGRPQSPGLMQAITTVLTVLGICAFVFGFAEWRLSSAFAPMERALSSTISDERRNAEFITEARIKNAVLEERLSWTRGQSVTKSDLQR